MPGFSLGTIATRPKKYDVSLGRYGSPDRAACSRIAVSRGTSM